MKIEVFPDIKDDVFYRTVKCTGLGTNLYTAEEERNYLEGYTEYIEFKNLTWSRKFNVDTDGNVIEDATNGETVTLEIINRKIKLDENFVADFNISMDNIKTSEIGTILKNSTLVAQAKCLLFELVIKDAIKVALADIRVKLNNFETKTSEIL